MRMETSGRIGVAISTTGDEHRMAFLETSVLLWSSALRGSDAELIVTVDGDAEHAQRVYDSVGHAADVIRVGQPEFGETRLPRDGRLGVATNKNTGIEALMDAHVTHLFLSDDDTAPRFPQSLQKHIALSAAGVFHSMVCWGAHRLLGPPAPSQPWAKWSWPRGVMLYAHQQAVLHVGGMDERFGPGGHEHVEWSTRMHRAGLTPHPFVSPASFATRNGKGANALWLCEDMRKPSETGAAHNARRKEITSVRRLPGDWNQIGRVMHERETNDWVYVSYTARANSRASATLYPTE